MRVRISWETGNVDLELDMLPKLRKRELAKIMKLAESCGGWRVIEDETPSI